MAHSTPHPPHQTRKYRLRNSPPSRSRLPKQHATTPSSSRGVLLPLQPNLRRLPSRIALFAAAAVPAMEIPQVGAKRKRVTSTNENAHAQGRSLRRIKRRRGYKECSEQSDMDIDADDDDDDDDRAAWMPTDEDEDDEDSVINRDHYHLYSASSHQLLRLRKEELVRLYALADPVDLDTDHLTKHDLVDSIIAARRDGLPPQQSSSPHLGPPSSPSSAGAGDEETDVDHQRSVRKLNGRSRSFSLGCLTKKSTRFDTTPRAAGASTRRRGSNHGDRSSVHSGSTTQSRRSSPNAASPPLATRLRTRTVSFHFGVDSPKKSVANDRSGRQVDSDESDSISGVMNFSPRRLRSRPGSNDEKRRITPMRKAKGRVGSLKESDDEEAGKDELQDDKEEMGTDTELDEDPEADEDEEVDQLESSVSPSPAPARRKLRALRTRTQKSAMLTNGLHRSRTVPDLSASRLEKPKPRRTRTQAYEASSDGDDEETDGENHGSESESDTQREEDNAEVEEEVEEMEVEVEPRRLRNGKVVGEEEEAATDSPATDDEDNDAEGEDDVASVDLEADSNSSVSDASGSEISCEEGVDEEDAGEYADEDEDLQDATAKTLVRRRRDHLVRLCESRGIEAEGTKPQLVEALLQWRDSQPTYNSSPSSGGTARPPSTTTPGRSHHTQTPVLLRPDRLHASDPDTPHPASNALTAPQSDDGVLLDLEGLGLEDSVIPPSKITKLDKIGSGGFKDVFVGKLGGKKVAIAEFRGQLTEMDIKELKLLSRFDHPNVVKFLGVSIPENPKETPMIVSELCSNGDLFDYVRNVQPPSLNKVLSLMLDIARGLKYLHDHRPSVIHRDCKSSNILITSRVTAKIADFGLAKVKQSTRSMVRSLVGTVNWQAPELWHAHPKYNFKVDVFSCAMVFWEILQWHAREKKFPWEGMNEHAIYDLVGAKQQRPSTSSLGKLWCPEIVELIESMWAQDHKDRPDMTYVVDQLEVFKDTYPPPRTHSKAR